MAPTCLLAASSALYALMAPTRYSFPNSTLGGFGWVSKYSRMNSAVGPGGPFGGSSRSLKVTFGSHDQHQHGMYAVQEGNIPFLGFLGLGEAFAFGFAFAFVFDLDFLAEVFLVVVVFAFVPFAFVAEVADEVRANRGCDAVRKERVGPGRRVATRDGVKTVLRDAATCIERRATRCRS